MDLLRGDVRDISTMVLSAVVFASCFLFPCAILQRFLVYCISKKRRPNDAKDGRTGWCCVGESYAPSYDGIDCSTKPTETITTKSITHGKGGILKTKAGFEARSTLPRHSSVETVCFRRWDVPCRRKHICTRACKKTILNSPLFGQHWRHEERSAVTHRTFGLALGVELCS